MLADFSKNVAQMYQVWNRGKQRGPSVKKKLHVGLNVTRKKLQTTLLKPELDNSHIRYRLVENHLRRRTIVLNVIRKITSTPRVIEFTTNRERSIGSLINFLEVSFEMIKWWTLRVKVLQTELSSKHHRTVQKNETKIYGRFRLSLCMELFCARECR